MLAVVGAMYAFAAGKHIVTEGFNPARGVTRFAESNRERFLTALELDRLGTKLREGETIGSVEGRSVQARRQSRPQRGEPLCKALAPRNRGHSAAFVYRLPIARNP